MRGQPSQLKELIHVSTALITSQADLACTIPSMLGFQPEESAVLVFEKNGSVVCTARADLETEQVTATVAHVAAHAPTSVSLVVYTSQDATAAAAHVERLTAAVEPWLTCHGGYVRSNMYYSQGKAPRRLDHTPAAVAAFTAAGTVTAGSRGEAMDMVTATRPDAGVAAALVTATIPDTAGSRRHVEDAVVAYLTSHTPPPDPATIAGWLIAMNASEIREPVLKRLSEADTSGRDHAARMLALVQLAPRVEQAAAATALAAALIWLTGDCARAHALAQEATLADPANVLGELVTQACANGMPPDIFTDAIAAMTLDQVRKT